MAEKKPDPVLALLEANLLRPAVSKAERGARDLSWIINHALSCCGVDQTVAISGSPGFAPLVPRDVTWTASHVLVSGYLLGATEPAYLLLEPHGLAVGVAVVRAVTPTDLVRTCVLSPRKRS